MKFSERYGYSGIGKIQIKSIDEDLKNRLWNLIINHIFAYSRSPIHNNGPNSMYNFIKNGIWGEFFNFLLDDFNSLHYQKNIRSTFFSLRWYEIYDFLEYIARNYPNTSKKSEFTKACNEILKIENSAYRFIGNVISQITSEGEIAEVEEAIKYEDSFKPVSIHIENALRLFTDRKAPDYRNSIKESISAVESICNLIIGGKKSTLGQALKEVEKKNHIHKALKSAFQNLYGYTNDAEGIRHALMDEPNLGYEDAKFMLISCSAFVNYLKEKSIKE